MAKMADVHYAAIVRGQWEDFMPEITRSIEVKAERITINLKVLNESIFFRDFSIGLAREVQSVLDVALHDWETQFGKEKPHAPA